MKMDWETAPCTDHEECKMEHWRYYDKDTDEIFGLVSGPDRNYRGAGGSPDCYYLAEYQGQTVGVFRNSTAAMERIQQVHEKGGPQLAGAEEFMKKWLEGALPRLLEGIKPGSALFGIPAPATPIETNSAMSPTPAKRRSRTRVRTDK